MKIRTRLKGETVILDIEGNIDIDASVFIETVGWNLAHKTKKILCNFSGVNLIDYIGVSILAIIYKNVLNHNGQIKFFHIPHHVKKLFSIVGLDKVLEYYDTEEEALAACCQDERITAIMKQKLRRRFARVPFKATIEYKKSGEEDASYAKGKILNISAVGVFIVGEKLSVMDTVLDVRLHLVPDPGIIRMQAKVVWISDKNAVLEYPAMGLEFYQISTELQQVIIDFVDSHSRKHEV